MAAASGNSISSGRAASLRGSVEWRQRMATVSVVAQQRRSSIRVAAGMTRGFPVRSDRYYVSAYEAEGLFRSHLFVGYAFIARSIM